MHGAQLVVAACSLALVAGGAGLAASGSGDEQRLSGGSSDQAERAALAYTNGGTVTEATTGDGGAAYEVKVRLANGDQVEVNLDADFGVLGQETDDGANGSEAGGEG